MTPLLIYIKKIVISFINFDPIKNKNAKRRFLYNLVILGVSVKSIGNELRAVAEVGDDGQCIVTRVRIEFSS
jgi:hypothetical protein